MFITSSNRGYTRDGQQRAAGRFLMVFSHNSYKWEEQNNTPHPELNGQSFEVMTGDGFSITRVCQCAGSHPYTYEPGSKVPEYYLKYCPAHGHEYKTMPKDMTRKLYACVRHVAMRQFGHFMMGSAQIAGQSVTVSGTYGSDGLPMDYETLSPAARTKVVEIPADLAEKFWAGGGHNSAGNEAHAMRHWARKTFGAKAEATN